MKKKDVITIIICLAIISVSGFFLYRIVYPPKTVETPQTTQKTETKFTGNIDEETLEQVKKLNDYGEANLDNVGRVNPFGSLN
jgi:hypothetical protein